MKERIGQDRKGEPKRTVVKMRKKKGRKKKKRKKKGKVGEIKEERVTGSRKRNERVRDPGQQMMSHVPSLSLETKPPLRWINPTNDPTNAQPMSRHGTREQFRGGDPWIDIRKR